jgi:hypothetical protein
VCLAPYAAGIGEPVPQPTSGYPCPSLPRSVDTTLLHLLEIVYGQKPIEQLRSPGGPHGQEPERHRHQQDVAFRPPALNSPK